MTTSKSYVTLKEKYDRVIVLIDMDCFYCQVEELLDDKIKNKPVAVVQYVENAGIIAVNYAARARGVTRHMREKEAKEVCSDLVCVKVPSKHGKADISKYRDAGCRVAKVFEKFPVILERASIDEAYLDVSQLVAERMTDMKEKKFFLTPHHLQNTYAVGYDAIGNFVRDVTQKIDDCLGDDSEDNHSLQSSKLRLLIGASIVSDIRKAVKDETGYECSAGIGHNKILAKLVCGMNKPNKQTILPIDSIPKLYETLELSKIKSMGGKIGNDVCTQLNVKLVSDLLPYEEGLLQQKFGPRVGTFLYLIARGIDLEKVEKKTMSKSIAVSKNFRGKNEIINVYGLKYWLKELSKEIKERVDKDNVETNRFAKQLIVQFSQNINGKDVASSRTIQLNGNVVNSLSMEQIAEEAFNSIEKNTTQLLKTEGKFLLSKSIRHLGISAGKLEIVDSSVNGIQNLLKNQKKKTPKADKKKKEKETTSENTESVLDLKKYEKESPKVLTSTSNESVQEYPSPSTSKNLPNEFEDEIYEQSENENFSDNENENVLEEFITDEDIDRDIQENKMIQQSLSNQYKVYRTFKEDMSIKGERTLKHWIVQLLQELEENLKDEIAEKNHAPTEIELSWEQFIDNENVSYMKEIPFNIFPNNFFSIEFLFNVMKEISKDFYNSNMLNPIVYLEIKPVKFLQRHFWRMKIHQEEIQMISHGESSKEIPMQCTEQDDEDEKDKSELCDLEQFLIDSSPTKINESIKNDESEELKFSETEESIMNENELSKSDEEKTTKVNEEKVTKIDETEKVNHSKSNEQLESDGNKIEDVAGPSYRETYAEFSKQNILEILNPLEECLECGKSIRKLEMMTHVDGHIAYQLAREQREEYRAEQKRKLQSKETPKSAKKIKKSKDVLKAQNLIDKFARQIPIKQENLGDQIRCKECKKLIDNGDFEIHMDHHYAQRIRLNQMKSNQKPNVSNNRKKQPSSNLPKTKSVKDFFA